MRKPAGLQVMHAWTTRKGLAFGPEGALYVAEAGRGGPASGLCWTSQAGSRSPLLRRDGRDLALLARKAGTDRHRSAVAARVWRVLPDGSKTIYADGLTQSPISRSAPTDRSTCSSTRRRRLSAAGLDRPHRAERRPHDRRHAGAAEPPGGSRGRPRRRAPRRQLQHRARRGRSAQDRAVGTRGEGGCAGVRATLVPAA